MTNCCVMSNMLM